MKGNSFVSIFVGLACVGMPVFSSDKLNIDTSEWDKHENKIMSTTMIVSGAKMIADALDDQNISPTSYEKKMLFKNRLNQNESMNKFAILFEKCIKHTMLAVEDNSNNKSKKRRADDKIHPDCKALDEFFPMSNKEIIDLKVVAESAIDFIGAIKTRELVTALIVFAKTTADNEEVFQFIERQIMRYRQWIANN